MTAPPADASSTAVAQPVGVDPASSARGFLQTLESSLKKLVTLKIVTVVGDVSVSGSGGDTAVTVQDAASVQAASTEVDLLDGHIVNVFSPQFSAAGAGALQAFHQSQVEKSTAIMASNLAELQKLAVALIAMRR